MNSIWRIAIAIVICFAVVSDSSAQQRQQRKPVNAKGKLAGAAAGMLKVEGEDGEQWIVKLDPRSRAIAFQGSAVPGFLRPGMIVSFRNSFDKAGRATAPIRELTVFTPREDSKLGLIPDRGLGTSGLFSDKEQVDPRKKKNEPVRLQVAGTLRSVKDGRIVVAAGGAAVRGQLSDKVQIKVDLADLRLAREGDTIDVSGWSYPGMESMVYANRVAITATRPLGLVEKAGRSKAKEKAPDLNSLDGF